jgi:hypothetical protein
MLFEIFFDSKGQLRDKIKSGHFDEVFELQRYAELKDSFDFIAEALSAAHGNFYTLPGKGHDLAVTVATKKVKDGYRVEAVYIDGTDVLRALDDDWDVADGERLYLGMSRDELKKKLSEQLVVPSRSLKVTYTPALAAKAGEIGFPRGWTVRKA